MLPPKAVQNVNLKPLWLFTVCTSFTAFQELFAALTTVNARTYTCKIIPLTLSLHLRPKLYGIYNCKKGQTAKNL